MIAVVDAWHAMTTDRVYRRAMSPEAARTELTTTRARSSTPLSSRGFLAQLDDA